MWKLRSLELHETVRRGSSFSRHIAGAGSMQVATPFIRKLEHAGPLTDEERSVLLSLSTSSRTVSARQDIVLEHQTDTVPLILSGVAGRYKVLVHGTRRIVSFALPGDLCRVHSAATGALDLRVAALTGCHVSDISPAKLREAIDTYPGISRALWWLTLTELSRAREWLVNDSRPADRRLAHHFCELLVCLQAVGLAGENSFELGIAQADYADALGISYVHVNRVMQALRSNGMISRGKHLLILPDVERIKEFAEFDPGYLCLDGLGL